MFYEKKKKKTLENFLLFYLENDRINKCEMKKRKGKHEQSFNNLKYIIPSNLLFIFNFKSKLSKICFYLQI